MCTDGAGQSDGEVIVGGARMEPARSGQGRRGGGKIRMRDGGASSAEVG